MPSFTSAASLYSTSSLMLCVVGATARITGSLELLLEPSLSSSPLSLLLLSPGLPLLRGWPSSRVSSLDDSSELLLSSEGGVAAATLR
ncbi:hypothetical protein PI125_g19349 [Phytophthora idaei]|nr:hypothetical protein PI125_g19349 [Phytophthora idaei]KAG3136392.1 hypothetical protein PI126_g17841 [Phytophthora idaei]